ncbi:MAG: ferritin family protein [bacterium]|nr:ferritin family protein [bacterium]
MSYSIKEIIDIAIGLEDAGIQFYTKCAKKFEDIGGKDGEGEDKNIKMIFTFLAKEEIVHKQMFESMLEKYDTADGEFTEEYFLYMKSIGGSRVFADKNRNIDQILDSINTPAEAVKKAFMDEKEAILFYTEVKGLYTDNSEAQGILDKIIEEERKHVLTLSELMEMINLSQ